MADGSWPVDARDEAHDADEASAPAGGRTTGNQALRLYDPLIVFLAGVLMTLGVAMVYSASVNVDGS